MGMNADDELLVAWLIKQEYRIMTFGAGNIETIWLIKQNATARSELVTTKTLGMWIDSGCASSPWKVRLHHTQRGKRRPLRSAVREWMFGI